MHAYINTYIHTHTHTHTHVYIHIYGHGRVRDKEGGASPLAAGGPLGSISTASLVNSMASVRTSSLHWVSSRTVFERMSVCVGLRRAQ